MECGEERCPGCDSRRVNGVMDVHVLLCVWWTYEVAEEHGGKDGRVGRDGAAEQGRPAGDGAAHEELQRGQQPLCHVLAEVPEVVPDAHAPDVVQPQEGLLEPHLLRRRQVGLRAVLADVLQQDVDVVLHRGLPIHHCEGGAAAEHGGSHRPHRPGTRQPTWATITRHERPGGKGTRDTSQHKRSPPPLQNGRP